MLTEPRPKGAVIFRKLVGQAPWPARDALVPLLGQRYRAYADQRVGGGPRVRPTSPTFWKTLWH